VCSSDLDLRCRGGRDSCAILPDGSIYVCGNFTGTGIDENEVKIGDIYQGIDNVKVISYANNLALITQQKCDGCQFSNLCYTFCPFVNFLSSNSIYKIKGYMCEINKIIIKNSDNIIDIISKNNQDIISKRFIAV
jgi:uncharacterized protein